MERKLLFVGVDVDDQSFHFAAVTEAGDLVIESSSRPNAAALGRQFKKLQERGYELKICYEATYLGFSLYRRLKEDGFQCEVIAPTSIPRSPGPRVKTDRIDSYKLASFFQKGLLHVTQPPTLEQEAHRDLLRSRGFLVEQSVRTRQHILSICRRLGLHYQQTSEKGGVSKNWTQRHHAWLEAQVNDLENPHFQGILKSMLISLQQIMEQIAFLDHQIESLAETQTYAPSVAALRCYRGVDTLLAMTLITEIVDINRFVHPRKIVSYAGMDIAEYSSGGKERKFSMTKMGNRYIRTALVEACQSALNPPGISRALAVRRSSLDPRYTQIADRCMNRLHKKGTRLLYLGKPRNKVKTACAREMIGFVWESLREARKVA